MYKFVMVQGSCGSPYNVASCEAQANKMQAEGYALAHVYQSTTPACIGKSSSVLVMVFKKIS